MPPAEIAERTGISPKYLEQIFMRLRTARVVRAKRGARGGYALARPADEVTVSEVVRAMDGPLAPSLCASQTAHAPCPAYRCPTEEACVMRDLWVEVRDAIAGILDQTTLATSQRASATGVPPAARCTTSDASVRVCSSARPARAVRELYEACGRRCRLVQPCPRTPEHP